MLYDPNAPKRATNLSVNEDLLGQARALDVNLSQIFERALEEVVRQARAAEWTEQNKQAIESHRRWVDKNGIFGAKYRVF